MPEEKDNYVPAEASEPAERDDEDVLAEIVRQDAERLHSGQADAMPAGREGLQPQDIAPEEIDLDSLFVDEAGADEPAAPQESPLAHRLRPIKVPVPSEAEGPAPTEAERPVPSEVEEPAPSEAEVPVPSEVEGPVPSEVEWPVPSEIEGFVVSSIEPPAASEVEPPAVSEVEPESSEPSGLSQARPSEATGRYPKVRLAIRSSRRQFSPVWRLVIQFVIVGALAALAVALYWLTR